MPKNIVHVRMARKRNRKNGGSDNLATIIYGYLRIPEGDIPDRARLAMNSFVVTTSAAKLIRQRSITQRVRKS